MSETLSLVLPSPGAVTVVWVPSPQRDPVLCRTGRSSVPKGDP
jgi:hypothetical protein